MACMLSSIVIIFTDFRNVEPKRRTLLLNLLFLQDNGNAQQISERERVGKSTKKTRPQELLIDRLEINARHLSFISFQNILVM